MDRNSETLINHSPPRGSDELSGCDMLKLHVREIVLKAVQK